MDRTYFVFQLKENSLLQVKIGTFAVPDLYEVGV